MFRHKYVSLMMADGGVPAVYGLKLLDLHLAYNRCTALVSLSRWVFFDDKNLVGFNPRRHKIYLYCKCGRLAGSY